LRFLWCIGAIAAAALPKERQRFNRKCSEITATLAKRVEQYNLLVEQYNSVAQQSLQRTTLDAVKKQEFDWLNDYEGKIVLQRQFGGSSSSAWLIITAI
jgi:hypothetical protein